ncbi:MAG: metallophosphoesterase family protein [Sedimentisphaerales bacterium]|nr:metallophosphoesterase family protein [Sedimentisphaerales bacterium]
MGDLLALMEWHEPIARGPFLASLLVLVLGECCLYFELSSRLLGTFVRTLPRMIVRHLTVWLACVALAVPFLLAMTQTGGWRAFWLLLSALVNLLLIVQFLFPYRFGIRTINHKAGVTGQEQLTPGIVLRRIAVEATLPPESPGSLRCLVISDLHCTWQFNLRKLRAALAALTDRAYDMVFVLGDLGESPALLPETIQTVAGLHTKYGIFCVRGNHDFERHRGGLIADLARENSIRLLANATYAVPELGIEIVGLEWPWDRNILPPPARATFAIGLSHTPDNIKLFSRLNVPLAVAGHTHAGKFRLPWIGSFPVGSKYGRFLDEGWFQFAGTRLYLTSGIRHFPGLFGRPGVIVELTITDSTVSRPDASGISRAD